MFMWYTKSFQWRISRVVEPQASQPKEKIYSIAAALPRPCYSSLVSQLTGSCLRTEERLAFSETEHRPLQTAEQLTILQQVNPTSAWGFHFSLYLSHSC